MEIPSPNEFAAQEGSNPFPGRWERWLSAVREGILSAQPQAGRNVSISEHTGKGTVINAERRPVEAEGPPGGACCGKTITFHDVIFDCGCFSSSGEEWTDTGFFNDNPVTLCIPNPLTGCPPNCDTFTIWGPICVDDNFAHQFIHYTGYGDGCENPPTAETDLFGDNVLMTLFFETGVWTLIVFGNPTIYFYGTTSDLSLPITNELSCGDYELELDRCDQFISVIRANSHSGTATIEDAADVCGACCDEGTCFNVTEANCADRGGTYLGDGTTCDPDPC